MIVKISAGLEPGTDISASQGYFTELGGFRVTLLVYRKCV